PTCDKCNNQWSWKQTFNQTFKIMWTLNTALICPHCGEKQYQTQKSKTKSFILTIMMLGVMIFVPWFFQTFYEIPVAILLSFIPIPPIVAFLLLPYVTELTSKEEF